MPTLYDNFNRVKDFINENNSSYVSKAELASASYITSDVKELTGPLYITYQETNNALYGLKSYSHIVAGDENKTSPAFLASKRYCANGIGSYINMASFFVNSDGRAKFAHKASEGGGNDDAFMCFNAYGFKIAYSGAAGTAASTEYELVHSGNIGNFGYASITYLYDNGLIFYPDTIDFDKIAFFEQDAYFEVATTYMSDLYINGNQINTVFPTYTYVENNFVSSRTDIPVTYIGYSFLKNHNSSDGSELFINGILANGIDIVNDISNPSNTLISLNDEGVTISGADGLYCDKYTRLSTWIDLEGTTYTHDIIPSSNNSYTLGTSNSPFNTTYTTNIYTPNILDPANSNNSIQFSNNAIRLAYNDIGFYLDNNGFRPGVNGNKLLGTSSNKWGVTYTSNIYADTAYLQDTSYTSSIVPKENNTYTLGDTDHFYYNTYTSRTQYNNNSKIYSDNGGIRVSVNNYNGFRFGTISFVPYGNDYTLGDSTHYWGPAYIKNLYADNIHNFIWTGTSAQYAALSDYTTYQIYMIEKDAN